MKGAKSVCLLCRLQVANAAIKTRARAAQRAPTVACFSTTSSRCEPPAVSLTRSETTPVEPIRTAEASPDPSPDPSQNTISTPRKYEDRHRTRRHAPIVKPRKVKSTSPSRVDVLFQQILDDQLSAPDNDATSVSVDLDLIKAIGRLQEMIGGKASLADAYDYFRAEVYPAVRILDVYVPQAYSKVRFSLLDTLVEAKKEDMLSEELPPVAEIFRLYAENDDLKPVKWISLVAELVQAIINIDPSSAGQDVTEADRIRLRREAMLTDLLESWKVMSLPRGTVPVKGDNKLTNGFWLPRVDKFDMARFSKRGNFSAAFCALFPQYRAYHLGAPFAMLGIATYALLHDSERCTAEIRQNAARFMSKIEYLIKYVQFRDKALQRGLSNTYPQLGNYITSLWPKIRVYLENKEVSRDEPAIKPPTAGPQTDGNQQKIYFNPESVGYRLGRCHALRSAGELDRLWDEFTGPYTPIPAPRAAQIRQYPHLIDSFIKVYMSLNRPDKAVEVWGVQAQIGLLPRLRTWNMMLQGLKNAKNMVGFKNVWAKLASSGMELDTSIWTTRISGLIHMGDIKGGLDALSEMVQVWRDSTDGEARVPPIEPVNAALAGLIAHTEHAAAEKLLTWAVEKGFKPDVVTFNTLLRPLIRAGDRNDDVKRVFTAMQEQGVKADEATFTLILDASFSKQEPPDPATQSKVVADVTAAMEASGLELNMHTYGKMIYLLLRSNATTAAMAIVNEIFKQNLELSPHIYTMLVEHCFAQHPPDLATVLQILQRRQWIDFDDMDRIFYERVVAGFTRAGAIQLALEWYIRVANTGTRLDLPTLITLLRALLRAGEVERARILVNTEKEMFEKYQQGPDPNAHHGYWNHQFWRVAEEYRLLDSPIRR
ncbi:hypothetical protein GGS20DRAFT_268376 [Poronia punctata]|nr:hypothetical protein GGS20DRAFT_268376 [Poronia punctata]